MKKKVFILITLILAALLLASCASAEMKGENYDNYYGEELAPEIGDKENGALADGDLTVNEGSIPGGQKLITTVDMTVESKEYDTLVNGILEKVKAAGGYVENSSVRTRAGDLRSATFTLRIPADKLSVITEAVEEGANVLYYTEKSVDVSLTYADLEGRLSSLRAEQTALNAMLEKADTVDTAIRIQKRLSEVRGEIESIEGQLRVLDSKISYSTLNLSVEEVEKETVVPEELTLWEEIKERFSENAEDTGAYLREMLVFFVGGIPTLLSITVTLLVLLAPPAIAVLIIVLVVKAVMKKKKKVALTKDTTPKN
ncbi:MAG: DUF4349 domain-containing protein [Clostridia bacterium]|nr:DUF4349 domain-containing protein [Clostridia bacterium]